ncbi:hypothetical protein C2E23DRAFT_906155 [Lenzites betulinus]|nr:hypothetical protein C2E23DRAFT_906155 [Lenzites betulinus]
MSTNSTYEQEIISDFPILLVENYCIVASSALLWFDCIITFPEEYRRIWRRKFTGATFVYLFMRYSAVFDRIFFVLEVLVWNSSDKVCGYITHTDDALLFINYMSLAAFTSLRVYGVWGRDWRPLLLVLPLSLTKPLVVMVENTYYVPLQAGPPSGCIYVWLISNATVANSETLRLKIYHAWRATLIDRTFCVVTFAAKAGIFAANSIVVILTWIKTFGLSRESLKTGFKTPLATLVLRDGTAYFLILFASFIITIITDGIRDSLTILLVWPYFDQVITVILCSRFILNLRGVYFATDGCEGDALTTLHLSDVRFGGITSTIVGNLGATLTTTFAQPVPAPLPAAAHSEGGDSPASATGADDPLDRAYEWDAAWREDVPEYCTDPFRSGFSLASSGSPAELEGAEKFEGAEDEIPEIRLADSPV